MNKKIATYLCCIILAAFAMNLTIISPLLPAISKSFSLGMAEAGMLFTAEFAGFMAFILIGGFLSERLGKKLVVGVALFGMTISITLFTMTGNLYTALLLMACIGGFGGVSESMVTAIVSDLNEVNRSFYVNLSQIFFGIGAIIGPLGAGFVMSSGMDWRVCYYFLSLFLLVLAVIFAIYKMPALPKSKGITLGDMGKAFKNVKFIAICLCMALYTGSEVGGWGWLSTLLKDEMGFSIAKAGVAVAVFWSAMTVGRFICGPLTLKFKLKPIIIILAAASSVVTVLAVFTNTEIILWLVIVLMGLTYSSQFPLIVDFGTENSPIPSGMAIAMLMGSGSIGSMLVPYFMGLMGDNVSLRSAMLIPTVLLMLIAIIFIGFKERQKVSRDA